MLNKTTYILLLIISIMIGCKLTDVEVKEAPPGISDRLNVLLIIGDDMGKDAMNGFSEGVVKPRTPNLDKLMADGLTFSNFWVNPTCSPTRAAILTGRYGYRTGVKDAGDVLPTSETILQKYINEKTNYTYATALIGKWHLSGSQSTVNPETFGIDYFAGILKGTVDDYYSWKLSVNGSEITVNEYATEKLTDLAIDWIAEQKKPWFMWMAYNAPHTPFHIPPVGTFSQKVTNAEQNPLQAYIASIESMDYDIGRLLASMSETELKNTMIIFLGDNGTPNRVAQSPYTSRTVKGTLYQGGVNTPLVFSGAGVSRRGNDDNLIAATDLFSTIADVAGFSVESINDSRNFRKLLGNSERLRDYIYTDIVNGFTIRDRQYKLIELSGKQEMYDLLSDPYEQTNLLNSSLSSMATSAKAKLEVEANKVRN